MPELEILEARAPQRTPLMVEPQTEPATARFAPLAGWFSGPVFSRAKDIFAANMTELLDRAEDPALMIRMIIIEMEETLVEIRATAARSIADMKELRRSLARLEQIEADWSNKAELALSRDREDLARAALGERRKATEMAEGLRSEIDGIEAVLRGYEADIGKIQTKLREARARQNAIAHRLESAISRARASELINGGRTAGRLRQVRHSRTPGRLCRRPCRRAWPDRSQGPRGRTRRTPYRRKGRRRARSDEGRDRGANSVNERGRAMARRFNAYPLARREKKLAGVCSTLGTQFGVDPNILRIGFVATGFFIGFQFAVISYFALAIYFAIQRKRQGKSEALSDFDRMEFTTRVRPSVHAMRTQLDPIDRRLMAIDDHIAKPNDQLAREIEALREDK